MSSICDLDEVEAGSPTDSRWYQIPICLRQGDPLRVARGGWRELKLGTGELLKPDGFLPV
jgi:hypothetical protein